MQGPEAQPRILSVDDDPDILFTVRRSLENEGFAVATADSAARALEWIDKEGLPHLAVVDIRMPGMGGLELAREIRRYCDLPIILLTAVDDEKTVVQALEEVAEDYVVKPFRPAELAARVKRVLRRIEDFSFAQSKLTEVDEHLSLDFAHQEAIRGGERIALTPTETKILHILARSRQRTVTTDYLLRRVWPLEEVFEDSLRVHIHRLRHKIEPNPSKPRYLITHRGLGYSLLKGS